MKVQQFLSLEKAVQNDSLLKTQ